MKADDAITNEHVIMRKGPLVLSPHESEHKYIPEVMSILRPSVTESRFPHYGYENPSRW
jgi:hypothetical protein